MRLNHKFKRYRMRDDQNERIMNKCPHCGKQAMSFWKKCLLGPARSTNCQACGNMVGVPWSYSSIAFLPLILVFILTTSIESSSLVLLLILLAGIPMFLLHGMQPPAIVVYSPAWPERVTVFATTSYANADTMPISSLSRPD